jgi:hypothetical protein
MVFAKLRNKGAQVVGAPLRAFDRVTTLPAVTGPMLRTNGTREWLVDGVRHREDGPAVERTDGPSEWWVNGVKIGEEGAQEPIAQSSSGNMKLDAPDKTIF